MSGRGAASLRLLDDATAPAAWNMAVDEALLDLAGTPTLRCYGWAPHAVSLGWFQPAAAFADLPPGTPLVRRLTGGGAIHHGDELTFALVLPATALPGKVADGYGLLHDAVVHVLAEFGVRAERLRVGSACGARPADRWCFAVPGRDDLVVDGRKLLGSAQRRVRTPRAWLLHHGSLVLHRPSLTPFVAAVADQRPVDDAFRTALRAALAARFAAVLDLAPAPGALSDAEHALAARLAAGRYADRAFLHQR